MTARALVPGALFTAARATPAGNERGIDLHRFKGRWHVIATIPTDRQKASCQPTVHYSTTGKGQSATWRSVLKDLFTPTHGVLFVNDDYSCAVVARGRRGLWILSRTPDISHADFFRCAQHVRATGFDARRLTFMPGPCAPGMT